MHTAHSLEEYREDLQTALDNQFLRATLDRFFHFYRANRAKAFADTDARDLIAQIAGAKDTMVRDMDAYFLRFKEQAEKNGVQVHLARDANEANAIITRIAQENGCKKIIKSKSMTSEETFLNKALEKAGLEVTETDLGEWIIQLRHEGPSHMVAPAIHLSREQVADLFSTVSGVTEEPDIPQLVKVARRRLRQAFAEADMGISGANFAIAETGTIGICCNEGNGRLTMTVPRVHVALCGLDKLTDTLHDALRILQVLPKNAVGQSISTYVNMVTGPTECKATPEQKKVMHVVFLDNGRSKIAKDPVFREVLRCVRCGACANICPVYRLVGGHQMGHIYIGAIGLILTYFYHGADKAKQLAQNCINCGACKEICAAGIDLPRLIQEVRARLKQDEQTPWRDTLLGKVMLNRSLFHSLLKLARFSQKPFAQEGYIRHLPEIFASGQGFRALPALATQAFRESWEQVAANNPTRPAHTAALFAGCVQDFVYPEQLLAAAQLFQEKNCAVSFPNAQSCCALPLQTMGEKQAAAEVARLNVLAFSQEPADYIVTLCASCAAQLKHSYPRLLEHRLPKETIDAFCGKVIDFSSYAADVLGYVPEDFNHTGPKVCYHSPCHLERGLEVTEQPRNLIQAAAEYVKSPEENVCCGFGGNYSLKFPEISAATLGRKLDQFEATEASTLVTDCPGCIMQLRGGTKKRDNKLEVIHMAELLVRQLKE